MPLDHKSPKVAAIKGQKKSEMQNIWKQITGDRDCLCECFRTRNSMLCYL